MNILYEDNSLWMTQKQMATAYDTDIDTISQYIEEVYADSKLERNISSKCLLVPPSESSPDAYCQKEHYNLAVSVAVGSKIKNRPASLYKKWAAGIAKNYPVSGPGFGYKTFLRRGRILLLAVLAALLLFGQIYYERITSVMVKKPVIYLYPKTPIQVKVNLDFSGKLTCTYPLYNDGWTVDALPDGTLSVDNQTYNYLYWEGKSNEKYDFSKGFCVPGSETASFLEDALAKLGLNRKEANEFIIYWLPLMQENPYNVISFQTNVYTDSAKLTIEPTPDTLIRVFMAWKPSRHFVQIPPQELTCEDRTGFTAVEWGGTQVH